MAAVYGYIRASTAGQQYTVESQRKAILAHYESKLKPDGHRLAGIFEDKATSGNKPLTEREGGRALWVSVQPGDIVIWSKLDRAFRNVVDGATTLQLFAAKGISIHSLDLALDTGTALGKFVMHLLVLLGELERDWIKTRTKEALAIRQEKGLPHGGRPPAGWKKRDDGWWVHDDVERKLIEWMIDQHDNRKVSWDRIVATLKRNDIRRANGDRYHQPWIHYALKARAAGYPGRDGWREQCQLGGSARREAKKSFRRLAKATAPRTDLEPACPG
jgi:putative DNA-invertase from lambdoid prophage Rac